jgi:two-component system, OmpR family, phosphate regulon sensor histidine kinase PhoR
VWNELKTNLISARVYFLEFLLFDLFIVAVTFIINGKSTVDLPLVTLLVIFSLLLLVKLGKKRNKELDEIKQIINNIRGNYYAHSDEIKLSRNLVSIQEDIKLMFEKTKSDIEYLKRLQRMRSEFLANVSHELRTPIFAIQGYIETLLNGAINDENVNKNFLSKANQHTLSLNNLLNDLIDISMIESGEMRMSFRYFKIDEYLRSLVNEFVPVANEKNLELVFHPCNENLQLFGDKERLRQVIVNLINNAIKYTEAGKIEVFVEEEPKFGRIIVRDTGVGIPEDDVNRIFERFYRVDKARSRAVGGTGLGLAIVKHIIEAHGSKIQVESVFREGSEFSFRLKK